MILYGLFPAARFPQRITLGPTVFDQLSRILPADCDDPAELERYRQLAANLTHSDGSRLDDAGVLLMGRSAFEGKQRIQIARFARDAVALSCVIAGSEGNAAQPGNWMPCISDFFEPLPVLFSTHAQAWILQSQNTMGVLRLPQIRSSLQLHLSLPRNWRYNYDDFLLKVLNRFLCRYGEGRQSKIVRVIWRAIGLTFNASLSFPGFVGALSDFANRITSWVSAFETLCHPLNGDVHLDEVMNVIRSVDWWTPRLRQARFAWKWRKKQGRESLPESWYRRLYNLRNALAHGSPVNSRSFRFRRTTSLSLHLAAPMVFRACLLKRLGAVDGLRRICNPPPLEMVMEPHYEDGLISICGLEQHE